MGHQHPMVRTTDTLGKKHVEPAWVVAPPNVDNIAEYYDDFNKDIELILMPAFNPLVGSVLNSKQKKHLGPVLNNKLFKLDDALVFRLDGTGLGKLESQG
jgi:metallophosphoesterase superfamily enzyme